MLRPRGMQRMAFPPRGEAGMSAWAACDEGLLALLGLRCHLEDGGGGTGWWAAPLTPCALQVPALCREGPGALPGQAE